MYKLAGIVLVIWSGVGCIQELIRSKKEKLENLREITKAIIYIKHELSYALPEIFELCEKTARMTKGDISCIFDKVSQLMHTKSNLDFYNAWNTATENKKLFSKKVQEITDSLFTELGKKSLDIELDNIKRAHTLLEEAEKDEEKAYHSDRKLICVLGAAACLSIVIVVI